jgi:hypothetical protein
MLNVVPMRRPESELFHSYRNMPPARELDSRIGLAMVMLLLLTASVSVFGLMFLGMLGVTTIAAAGIGSTIHFKFPYQVPSCIPSQESEAPANKGVILKAA